MQKCLTSCVLCLACSSCLMPVGTEPTEPNCSGTRRELSPGETEFGTDPSVVLARYLGSWQGTLTWAGTEETTTFRIDVTRGTEPMYRYPPCGDAESVYTYPNVALQTADAAIESAASGTWSMPRPGTAYRTTLSLPGFPCLMWREALQSRLPVSLSAYDCSKIGLSFELEWPADATQPTKIELVFHGAPKADPSVTDTIPLGVVVF